MPKPRLSIRSAKAKELAHALARQTGMPMSKLVARALERYDNELRQQSSRAPIDVLMDLMAEGRQTVPASTTSAHDDFYDEYGVPR